MTLEYNGFRFRSTVPNVKLEENDVQLSAENTDRAELNLIVLKFYGLILIAQGPKFVFHCCDVIHLPGYHFNPVPGFNTWNDLML